MRHNAYRLQSSQRTILSIVGICYMYMSNMTHYVQHCTMDVTTNYIVIAMHVSKEIKLRRYTATVSVKRQNKCSFTSIAQSQIYAKQTYKYVHLNRHE